jgi:hypothetical protein
VKTVDRLDRWIPLRDAVRLFPKNSRGRRPHRSCIFRWAKDGKRGVVLRTWLAGVCLCTSRRAVFEFISQLSASSLRRPPDCAKDHVEVAREAGERLKAQYFSRSRQPLKLKE